MKSARIYSRWGTYDAQGTDAEIEFFDGIIVAQNIVMAIEVKII